MTASVRLLDCTLPRPRPAFRPPGPGFGRRGRVPAHGTEPVAGGRSRRPRQLGAGGLPRLRSGHGAAHVRDGDGEGHPHLHPQPRPSRASRARLRPRRTQGLRRLHEPARVVAGRPHPSARAPPDERRGGGSRGLGGRRGLARGVLHLLPLHRGSFGPGPRPRPRPPPRVTLAASRLGRPLSPLGTLPWLHVKMVPAAVGPRPRGTRPAPRAIPRRLRLGGRVDGPRVRRLLPDRLRSPDAARPLRRQDAEAGAQRHAVCVDPGHASRRVLRPPASRTGISRRHSRASPLAASDGRDRSGFPSPASCSPSSPHSSPGAFGGPASARRPDSSCRSSRSSPWGLRCSSRGAGASPGGRPALLGFRPRSRRLHEPRARRRPAWSTGGTSRRASGRPCEGTVRARSLPSPPGPTFGPRLAGGLGRCWPSLWACCFSTPSRYACDVWIGSSGACSSRSASSWRGASALELLRYAARRGALSDLGGRHVRRGVEPGGRSLLCSSSCLGCCLRGYGSSLRLRSRRRAGAFERNTSRRGERKPTMPVTLGLDYGTNSVRALLVRTENGEELGTAVVDYPSGQQGVLLDPRDPQPRPPASRATTSSSLEREREAAPSPRRRRRIPRSTRPPSSASASTPPARARSRWTQTNVPAGASSERFEENLDAQCWLWKDHTGSRGGRPHHRARRAAPPALSRQVRQHLFLRVVLEQDLALPATWRPRSSTPPSLGRAVPTGCRRCSPASPIRRKVKRGVCAAGHKALYCRGLGRPARQGVPRPARPEARRPARPALRRRPTTRPTTAGTLCPEWAEKLGLPAGIPIAIGEFDVHYGAIGCGVDEGTLVKVIGTSTCDCARRVAPTRRCADIPGICGIVKGAILPGYYGIEAGQSAVGDIFKWWVEVRLRGRRLAPRAAHRRGRRPASPARAACSPSTGTTATAPSSSTSASPACCSARRSTRRGPRSTAPSSRPPRSAPAPSSSASRSTACPSKRIVCAGGIAEKNPLLMQIYADVTGRRDADRALLPGLRARLRRRGGRRRRCRSRAAMPTTPRPRRPWRGSRAETYAPIATNKAVYDQLFALYAELHDAFGGVRAGRSRLADEEAPRHPGGERVSRTTPSARSAAGPTGSCPPPASWTSRSAT